jgi:hypothetical protein
MEAKLQLQEQVSFVPQLKNLFLQPTIEPRFIGCPAYSVVTIQNEYLCNIYESESQLEHFVHCTVQVTARHKTSSSNGQHKTISYTELFILGFLHENLI